jgi:hypothetical protein
MGLAYLGERCGSWASFSLSNSSSIRKNVPIAGEGQQNQGIWPLSREGLLFEVTEFLSVDFQGLRHAGCEGCHLFSLGGFYATGRQTTAGSS